MLRSITLTLVAISPALAATPSNDGVLLLTDGSRVAGKIQKRLDTWIVRRGATVKRFKSAEVRRMVSRKDLMADYHALATANGADTAFATAQRGIWAFENGLRDEGLTALAQLLAVEPRPASFDRLESSAARHLIDFCRKKGTRVDVARELLLSMQTRKKDAASRARAHATSRAIALLLADEARDAAQSGGTKGLTAKNAKSLANFVRKYAADAISPVRRRTARRSLLAHDTAAKQFVWRQAMLWPKGRNRSAVVADIRDDGTTDDASLYLTRWLNRGNSTLKLRSAEALGALGSPKALPALSAMRKSIREMVKSKLKRRGGPGSTRANISVTEQQSIVSDFNVEVAQGAAIADPVVTTIMSGVVLDVTVGGIAWDRYIILLDNAVKKSIGQIKERAEIEKLKADDKK